MSLPVIEAFCQYHQPARYDDEIEIRTRATLLTPVRIRFDYEVVRVADGTAVGLRPQRPCRPERGRDGPAGCPNGCVEMLNRPAGHPGSPTVYN